MIILWHENDLRIANNKALHQATMQGEKIIPLFIWEESSFKWPIGEASSWWLHHALKDLDEQYKAIGGRLTFFKENSLKVFQKLIKEFPVKAVYFNVRLEPERMERDLLIKKELESKGIEVLFFNSNHVINPETFLNLSKEPYSVFTPFYNAILKSVDLNFEISKKPTKIEVPRGVDGIKLEDLDLLPKKAWTKKLQSIWKPSHEEIISILNRFAKVVAHYSHDRDFPAIEGTSKLSPYLHFGQVSPQQIYQYLKTKVSESSAASFFRQLVWREFGMYFLYHFPKASDKNWREKFNHFPWRDSPKDLEIWKRGETGYPIVDAGMKQLWQTGWMHNRVRMIVGSFLIKDLRIHWKEGALWFWDTLVDADLANNTLGWQWVAGSGPDASPFFRIFNPILQGEKFDPEGEYVKTYLPQLRLVPKEWIHKLWLAPEAVLKKAGVVLGENYPKPIVDHDEKRKEALSAYQSL